MPVWWGHTSEKDLVYLFFLAPFCFFYCIPMIFTSTSLFTFCQPITRFDELPDEFDAGRGSFDDGDPQTTNLYVGNLSPKVSL